jgi:hypothetical protein
LNIVENPSVGNGWRRGIVGKYILVCYIELPDKLAVIISGK